MSSPGRSFLPPPVHPSRSAHSAPIVAGARPEPPRLAPRPQAMHVRTEAPSDTQASPSTPGEFEPVNDLLPPDEEELSEVALRERYDDEEIDRFLQYFSAYVREARLTDVPGSSTFNVAELGDEVSDAGSDAEVSENGEAMAEDSLAGDLEEVSHDQTPPSLPPRPQVDRDLAERIALDYVVPLLPPQPAPPPAFNIRRLQLTSQRVYLATKPAYLPLIMRLAHLATWQDVNTSRLYCAAYWFSWYYNFLLPALILRILYSLLRRKVLPYPNLEELRQHRQEVERAKDFSEAITTRLAVSPVYDVSDVWKVLRDFHRTRKLKKAAKRDETIPEIVIEQEVIPTKEEEIDEADMKRSVLAALNDVADLHERVRNLFLWRQSALSVKFAGGLVVLFCLTLLPALYLAKLLGFVIGVGFWHVVPIIVAIPAADRARIPKPLVDVPTDIDYAMELISQRVARGLDIKPRRSRPTPSQTGNSDTASISSKGSDSYRSAGPGVSSPSVDWKKWGDRAASTKAHAENVKGMLRNGQWKKPTNWMALNPLAPKIAIQNGMSVQRMQTYTFPAQYRKASGLITLTSDTFHFTPLLSSAASLSIPLADMLGVKKTGSVRGLAVQWRHSTDEGIEEERSEKFLWVGARNELFARLIAWGGRRWSNI